MRYDDDLTSSDLPSILYTAITWNTRNTGFITLLNKDNFDYFFFNTHTKHESRKSTWIIIDDLIEHYKVYSSVKVA